MDSKYFDFCRPYPSSPATTAVFGSSYLSSLYFYLTLYRGCGLAYPYNWRGFVGAKKVEPGPLSIYSFIPGRICSTSNTDVSLLHQPVLTLDASFLQQPVLPLNVSFLCCLWTCLCYLRTYLFYSGLCCQCKFYSKSDCAAWTSLFSSRLSCL
jgi:hypothetical protein